MDLPFHQKLNVQVAEQHAKRLKGSLGMRKVLALAVENWTKSAINVRVNA